MLAVSHPRVWANSNVRKRRTRLQRCEEAGVQPDGVGGGHRWRQADWPADVHGETRPRRRISAAAIAEAAATISLSKE
jgi:hypothetical protein